MPEKPYKHVFFDLDHTLWDYEKNAEEALTEMFLEYGLDQRTGFTARHFVEIFFQVNEELWDYHDRGMIEKSHIRKERFNMIFTKMDLHDEPFSLTFSESYIQRCPYKGHVVPFAREVLEYLKNNYKLHVITNGFEKTQHIKIRSSGLTDYFDGVFISEKIGFRKPMKEIFDYAIQQARTHEKEAVMIGDNLKTDILGAKNSSIDQIFFNPGKKSHQENVTYEIDCLSKLMNIL